jgi:class 3 adenylate cyclase
MVVAHHRLDALGQLALDMGDALRRYNSGNGTALAMRIGMHAGPAVAGVIGVKRFLYDVWGDTVNVASRMESSGEPGAVHVSEAVYLQTRQHFAFTAREPIHIKGRGRMSTYWLLGRAGADAAQACRPAMKPGKAVMREDSAVSR